MTNLYNIMPSEVGRLMLGFIEERGFTKSAECLLEELPELHEMSLQRKKGLKVRPRIDGYTLVELLNDFFQAKDIIYENIDKYPSTFSSVKKILQLSEQVQIIIDIAINKQTCLDFRKKQPKKFASIPNHLAGTQSSHISVSVGGHGITPNGSPDSESNETGQILFTVQNSALKKANQENTNSEHSDHHDRSQCEEDRNTSDFLGVSETSSNSPAKRKGSVRKKCFPSPKNKHSLCLDSAQKNFLDNLMTDSSLHAKLADTINKSLENYPLAYLSSHSNNPYNDDETNKHLPSNNGDVCKNDEDSRNIPKNFGLPDNIIRDLSKEFINQLSGQHKQRLEKSNDNMSTVSSEFPHASSHRVLTTPVPQFSPHDNFSLNTSLFNSLQHVDEMASNSQLTNLAYFDQCLKSDFSGNSTTTVSRLQSTGDEPSSTDYPFNLHIPSLVDNAKEINTEIYGTINSENDEVNVENVVNDSEVDSCSGNVQLPVNVPKDACLTGAGGENCLDESISLCSSLQNIDNYLQNKMPSNLLTDEREPNALVDNQVVEAHDSHTLSGRDLRLSRNNLPGTENKNTSELISDPNSILSSKQNVINDANLNGNDFDQMEPSSTVETLNNVSEAACSHLTSFSPNYPSPAIAIPVNSHQLPLSNYFSGTPDHSCNYTLTELTPLSPTLATVSSLQKQSDPPLCVVNNGSSSIYSAVVHTTLGESVVTEIPSLAENQDQSIVTIIPMKSSHPGIQEIISKTPDRDQPSSNIDELLTDLKDTRQRKKKEN